jgi:hypothetical protein
LGAGAADLGRTLLPMSCQHSEDDSSKRTGSKAGRQRLTSRSRNVLARFQAIMDFTNQGLARKLDSSQLGRLKNEGPQQMSENVHPWLSIERLDISGGSSPGKSKVHAEITALSGHGPFRIVADFELEIGPQVQWKSIQTEAVRRIRLALDPELVR